MKLKINNEWLRNRVDNEPDIECDIGIPICRAEEFVNAVHQSSEKEPSPHMLQSTPSVLSLFVHQLRRRDKLSVQELADRIRVDEEEIKAIETDPAYGPEPRTLHQLATYSKVPAAGLLRLVPDASNVDADLENAALKFAASSDDISALSRTERKGLNEFVKFLTAYKGAKNADAG